MIDPISLEQAASARSAERAPLLIAVIEALERGEGFAAGLPPAEGHRRLAAAALAILADPTLEMDAYAAQRLVIYGSILNSLFAACPPGPWGAALETVLPQPKDLATAGASERDRYLALLTLDAPVAPDLDAIFALPAPLPLLKTLSFVATSPVLTAHGAARREAAIEAAERLAGAEIPPTFTALSLVALAWLTCSYASAADKHRLKAALNPLLRDLLGRLHLGDAPSPAVRPLKDRPTLVVAAEVIHAGHVQYRYFGQYLRQLRERFRLVLVAPARELGAEVEALFDEVFAFDPASNSYLGQVVAFVTRTAPDILFWPSVGMARWGPLLANLRLAPIQMTALGHSASTFIPQMDYYLTEEGYASDPALFSERLLLLPDDSLRFERPPAYRPIAPEIRDAANPVRVAVPSNLLKLNPAFIDLLRRVRREARRPVQFHLFPNGTPVQADALRSAVQSLGDVVVYPRLRVQAYLGVLNACDMVLSPFPFGGLHSVVDALRQGLPVVAMERPEPHGRTDAMILRRLQMPPWLVARTEDDYVAAALRLIEDDAVRVAVSREALARDVDRMMFGDATTPLGAEVSDAVWAAYRYHEAIQADKRAAWRLSELRALEAADAAAVDMP